MLEPNLIFPRLVARRAAVHPDRPLLEMVGGPSLTYGEVHASATRLARGLAARGVARGSKVLVMLPTSPESVLTWLACAWLRAVQVPLNPDYRGTLLRHAVELAGPVLAIADEEGAARLADVGFHDTVVGIAPLLADAPPRELEEPAEHDPACVLLTSGTTGPSKAVLVSWRQFYQQATGGPFMRPYRIPPGASAPEGIDCDLGWTVDHAVYSPLPHFHLAGKTMVIRAALPGGRIVMRERFATDAFWDDIRAHGCTETVLLGAMAQFLYRQPPREDDATGPLEAVQMPPLIPEARAFAERFGVRLWTCYASTECSTPLETGYDWEDWRSCGRPNPGYELRIVDPLDREVPHGEVGELVVRTQDPWLLNLGYLGNPEATARAWRNGWLHTGDAMRRDEDGNFFFVDRMGDKIRSRGENISSLELEAETLRHPGVAECAAVGVPSEWGEEDVLVVVVPRPGAALDPADVVAFLQDRVPRFMVPRYVRVAAALPKTPTEKVRKAVLREEGVGEGTFDRRLDRPTAAAAGPGGASAPRT